jgi:endonuclease/exonuclease/phosphatase family metal-dependent hydrolase
MQIQAVGRPAALGLLRAVAQACMLFSMLVGTALGSSGSAAPASLKIATWNLEWLIAPAVFKTLKTGCMTRGEPIRGDVRRLPCDVVTRFERSSRDFFVLARYARELNADVVALQEVDGAEAARLVFPGYEFCFTSRRHVQNNGFAIRRGVPFRCAPDVRTISLNDALRRGAELVLFPGTRQEIHLLSVHLKSGCASKPLSSPGKPCRDLSRQIPALEDWIDTRAREGKRFAVLGDFNRDLLAAAGDDVWKNIDDADPPESDLRNAASGTRFRNCVPGQGYRAYIDHIVLSRTLGAEAIPGSFGRVTFTATDARHTRLSDHCPVSIVVRSSARATP